MPQALAALLPTIFGAGGVAASGTVLGTVISTALNLGLAVGASALAASLQKSPKPQDVQNVLRQSIPNRRRILGIDRVGGNILFIETKRGNLYQLIGLSQGVLDGIQEVRLDDRIVTLDVNGQIISQPYNGRGLVYIKVSEGRGDQLAQAELIAEFPDIWTVNHRCRGIVTLYIFCKSVKQEFFTKIYPRGLSQPQIIGRFGKVYDLRNPAHDPDDTDTWAFSQNLALLFMDYVTHPDGMQFDRALINVESWSLASDISDEILPTKSGGSVARYFGRIAYDLPDDPADVMDRFLKAMDGRTQLLPDGTIGLSVGKWVEPTVHIDDAKGHVLSYEFTNHSGPLSETNEVIVEYTFPEAGYTDVTSDPWRDEANISETGQVKTSTLSAYEVITHNHARRLAKMAFARLNPKWEGTIVTSLYGMKCWTQRWIRLSIPECGILNEPFEIIDIDDSDPMSVTMRVAYFDGAAVYAFNPVLEEGTAPKAPELLAESDVEPVQSIDAIVTRINLNGNTPVAVIRVTWTTDRDDLDPQVEFSLAGEDKWQAAPVAPNRKTTDIVGLEDGKYYDVRVRLIAPSGVASTWVMVEDILVLVDNTAPASPADLMLVADGGDIEVSWRTPNSQNFFASRVFRAAFGQPFSSAVDITGQLYGSANQVQYYMDSPAAGSYSYWVTAENTSGVRSAPLGPESIAGGLEPETSAYLARMSGTPTTLRVTRLDDLIKALKTANVWSKLDAVYVPNFDLQASTLNLKGSSYTLVPMNSPVFTVDRGFAGGGSAWLDTGFNPTTAGGNYATNSAFFGLWSRTDTQETSYEFGSTLSAANNFAFMRVRSTTDTFVARINDATNISISNANGSGFFGCNRSGASARQFYRNGASIGSDSVASTSMTNSNFATHRMSTTYSAKQIACLAFGSSLNGTEQTALYNALYAYMQAIGAV